MDRCKRRTPSGINVGSKPVYLFNLIPTKNSNYNTRNTDKITLFRTKHYFFKFFFPSTVIEWNKLDPNLWSAASLTVFKKNSLKFIRPSPNSVFNGHNCKGMNYFTRLCHGLSQLREHKFKHSFQDTLNPFFSCGLGVETNTHFFFTAPCSVIKDAPSWAQLMIFDKYNWYDIDSYSSLW